LHGTFENYASDENLGPVHWFWDRSRSGGIFIEHGVHFFDLFAGWLGPGQVVAAQRGLRPGSSPPIEEHVHCTVRYGPSMLVNFYHGFHQTGRMDRQELRLVFERGSVKFIARLSRAASSAGPRSALSGGFISSNRILFGKAL
jgi:predicted dehydrogenase